MDKHSAQPAARSLRVSPFAERFFEAPLILRQLPVAPVFHDRWSPLVASVWTRRSFDQNPVIMPCDLPGPTELTSDNGLRWSSTRHNPGRGLKDKGIHQRSPMY